VKTFQELREGKVTAALESVEESVQLGLTEATVSRSDFEKLKKGMRIEIDFGSSISSSQKRVFTVKSTSRSAKYNVDKINMTIDGKGKYHLYSRNGKDATLALGNMAASIKSYKILGTNESVELDEAADFEKISNELLKHKKKGIEFEKAAAFARVMFMNSSLSVQDKAFMGLTKLLKDMDDLVKRTTITKILKDNGFRVKGGKLMREGLEESVQSVTNIKFDYGDTVPNNAKPSEIGSLKQDWNTDKMAVRSAVKSLGGLVTDSEAPSRSNKFVGKLSVGTRGDASKLSNGAIQKAVKSKGAEIQSNQFMKEFVELEERVELIDENYRILATKGMGAETKNSINVGRDVDFYEPKNGDKRMGKITKMTKSGYVVKDEKDGKSYTFAFHDRAKAKALLAK
jgi:hypothetical protein